MSDEQGSATGEDGAGPSPTPDGIADRRDGEDSTGLDDERSADDPIEAIAERVRDEPSETIAEEIATLREDIADLRTEREDLRDERDDLESRLKRKQAEFQNYKKRQQKRREQEMARATEALVEELLEVRDNLSRALEQDEGAEIRDGVEATFRVLEDVLTDEGVESIEPEPGTETDPNRHEVLLRVESDEPSGTVADLHRPGYEMAGKVLRAAQVTVSEGSDDGGESGGADDSGESAPDASDASDADENGTGNEKDE